MSDDRIGKELNVGLVLLVIGVATSILFSLGVFSDLQARGLEIRTVISSPIYTASATLNSLGDILGNVQDIQIQNQLLKQENLRLNTELLELTALDDENSFLRKELQLGVKTTLESQVAEVLRYEYSPQPGTIYIRLDNQYTSRKGDWLVRDGFIVGKISSIFSGFAKADLVNSNLFQFPVIIGEQKQIGRFVGRAGVDLAIEGVEASKKIKVRDAIRLLNSENPIMESYILGFVESVVTQEITSMLDINVITPVSLDNLDFVLIIPARNV